MTFETTALILAWVSILILGLTMSGLVRQIHILSTGQVPRALRVGPPLGVRAQHIEDLNRNGSRVAVLVFATPDCAACQEVLADLKSITDSYWEMQFFALFPTTFDDQIEGRVEIAQQQADAFAWFGIAATPFSVALDEDDRVIGSAPVGSVAAFRSFVGRVAEGSLVR